MTINNVPITGRVEPCVWNAIHYFHVTNNFSVDIMHDWLEGVCNYNISGILRKFIIDLRYFSS